MSIKLRLVIATALIALMALAAADIATYATLRSSLYNQVDESLEMSHQAIESSISGRSGPAAPPSAGQASPSCPALDGDTVDTGGLNPGTVIEVRNRAGATVYTCVITELGSAKEVRPSVPSHISGFVRTSGDDAGAAVYFSTPAQSGSQSFRVRASVLEGGPDAGGELIVAVPLTSTSGVLSELFDLELVVSAGAVLFALLLSWWSVRTGLRPLRDVERTAEAISAGRLTERVPGDQARTEVGRVARALNVMLERIQTSFAELRASEERMRRFVADASHELRTPLAAVTAYADLFDRGAADRPDDLRRVLRGIQNESGRMSHLVQDLLLLAHLDEGAALYRQPVDLVALAADAVATAQTVGPQWPVQLRATHPIEVEADALQLRQVLDNLLGNVRVHCPEGTAVTVTVGAADGIAEIVVSDDGPGLSEEEATHIFERFFRTDPSRSRVHGGAGLGLAIVAAIVGAHGGSVAVSSSPEGGASFAIRLPESGASDSTGGARSSEAQSALRAGASLVGSGVE